MKVRKTQKSLVVRALRTKQGNGVDVYAFFLPGSELLRVAEVSRLNRNKKGNLEGFQRADIRKHVYHR